MAVGISAELLCKCAVPISALLLTGDSRLSKIAVIRFFVIVEVLDSILFWPTAD